VTQMISSAIFDLRSALDGEVLAPQDQGYDDARRVWNGGIDRRPALIARCASASDVAEAIKFAREHDLEISVRGGAHSTAGSAVCDDGLMIDLSALSDVNVDPRSRRARVGGGSLLADLDSATMAHGLAVPAGLISHTGVGGLTLGGGMGWLTRKFGLSIDNLHSADVVTADGQQLRAADDENADLFWAIRGGGGNFGVVTGFEFGLHEVEPMVQLGLFFWSLEQGTEVLRLCGEVTRSMPAEVNAVIGALNAPPAPFVPEEYHFTPGYALILIGFGSDSGHARLADEIRQAIPPLFELVTPVPYVELQKMLDEANAWGQYGYEKAAYLQGLSNEVIDVITDRIPRKNSPQSALLLYRLDGAYSEVPDDQTAFSGGRSPRYDAFILDVAPNPDLYAADRTWVRETWDAMRPFAMDNGDGYINGLTEFGEDRVRGSYGAAKYDRLARLKGRYDPDNVFHLNANIRPQPQPNGSPR
jgi:FAD/FMN-containing dehydrogenase